MKREIRFVRPDAHAAADTLDEFRLSGLYAEVREGPVCGNPSGAPTG